MMTETQAWSLKFNEVANLIRHLKSRKPLNSTGELWLKSLKSDAKEIIGNLKKLSAKDPAAAQAVRRFTQELRAFDTARATQNGGISMNTIKHKMNYHASEYRRLKALAMDADPMTEIKKHLSDGMAAAKEIGAYESKYRAAQNKMGAALDGLRGIINANKNNPEVLRAANDAYRKITGL